MEEDSDVCNVANSASNAGQLPASGNDLPQLSAVKSSTDELKGISPTGHSQRLDKRLTASNPADGSCKHDEQGKTAGVGHMMKELHDREMLLSDCKKDLQASRRALFESRSRHQHITVSKDAMTGSQKFLAKMNSDLVKTIATKIKLFATLNSAHHSAVQLAAQHQNILRPTLARVHKLHGMLLALPLLRLWTAPPVRLALEKVAQQVQRLQSQLKVQESNHLLRSKRIAALLNRKEVLQRDLLDLQGRISVLQSKLPKAGEKVLEKEKEAKAASAVLNDKNQLVHSLQQSCAVLQTGLSNLHRACEETARTVEQFESTSGSTVVPNQGQPVPPPVASRKGVKRSRAKSITPAAATQQDVPGQVGNTSSVATLALPLPPPVPRRMASNATSGLTSRSVRYRTLSLADTSFGTPKY